MIRLLVLVDGSVSPSLSDVVSPTFSLVPVFDLSLGVESLRDLAECVDLAMLLLSFSGMRKACQRVLAECVDSAMLPLSFSWV